MKILKQQKNGKYQINDVSEDELRILNNVFRFSPYHSHSFIGTSMSLTELMTWMKFAKISIEPKLRINGNTFEIIQCINTPNTSISIKGVIDAQSLRDAIIK